MAERIDGCQMVAGRYVWHQFQYRLRLRRRRYRSSNVDRIILCS